MKRLVVGVLLSYDMDKMDANPDDYDTEEIIEMLRVELQDRYAEFDLEVEVRDYIIEEDGLSVDWG